MTEMRPRALSALRDGRVTLKVVSHDRHRVEAEVESSRDNRPAYVVDHWPDGDWCCTCPAFTQRREVCAHVAAVQLVTGWESAARKPVAASG